jgi:hypothetical protein
MNPNATLDTLSDGFKRRCMLTGVVYIHYDIFRDFNKSQIRKIKKQSQKSCQLDIC